MRKFSFVALVSLLVSGAATAAVVGPLPYLAAGDSPFTSQTFSTFVLETFDGATRPGYTRSGGIVLGPAPLTDSVGGTGNSLYSNGATSLSFDFTPYLLSNGVLPNRAGIVWTDVGYQFGECCGSFVGVAEVRFEAFDQNNISLGTRIATLGDGVANGSTAEDRFFGASNAGGISRLVIAMPTSDDWEVDHLQFGTAVPEPASWAMLIIGFGLVGAVARQRQKPRIVLS
jgi:PEP-CTERM motif